MRLCVFTPTAPADQNNNMTVVTPAPQSIRVVIKHAYPSFHWASLSIAFLIVSHRVVT